MGTNSWVDTARCYTPGIPAGHRLAKIDDLVTGDKPMPRSLATVLGAAAYRLKNGQSVALALPHLGPESVLWVLDYLHSCRTEALMGYIRAPWFQPSTMSCAPDLILWTRNLRQKRLIQEKKRLNPVFLGKLRDPDAIQKELRTEEKLLRTVVCQQDRAMEALCEVLQKQTSPFVIVIDSTPWGVRDFTDKLTELMADYFPGTPCLLLSAVGDEKFFRDLNSLRTKVATWSTGLADEALFGSQSKSKWAGKVIRIPDHRLDQRLSSIYYQLKILDEELNARQSQSQDVKASLFKAWKTILSLVVPIEFYELCADKHRQGGRYPLMPIVDTVTLASRTKMPTQAAQESLEKACNEINNLVNYLKESQTGKQQAIFRWFKETLEQGKRGLIALPYARSARVLRQYLLQKHPEEIINGTIQVIGYGSVKDLYDLKPGVDRVLVPSSLFLSDYWVAGLGSEFTWLNYPIEETATIKWSSNVRTVKYGTSKEAKEAWWLFEPVKETEALEPLEIEEWTNCAGQYQGEAAFTMEFEPDENWAVSLMEDLEWKESSEPEYHYPESRDMVAIHTGSETRYFYENQNIDILDEIKEETHVIPASEVKVGQIIVLQDPLVTDAPILDTVMQAVYGQTSELELLQTLAEKCRPMLHEALKAVGGSKRTLERKLSEIGVTKQTLQSWLDGKHTIRKHKDKIIPVVARLAGDAYSENTAQLIRKSIGQLQGKRSASGKILHKARLAIARGRSEIQIGGEILPLDLLKEAVNWETVIAVNLPRHEEDEEDEKDESWIEQITQLATNSDGKIILTNGARKSLESCQYRDHARAIRCFQFLNDEVYSVYFQSVSLEHVVEILKKEGVIFRGGMATTTQGQFKSVYRERQYKGQRADLSKHLRIGHSYNPERCFNLHFQVDGDDSALVVHHAGEHLPTTNS